MKIFLKYVIITTFALQLMACTTKDGNENNSDLHEIENIFIKLDRKKTPKLKDIFKNIEYVSLETNDSVLLPELNYYSNSFRLYKDQFFFSNSRQIFVFNNKGKWIYTINQQGEGPNNYRTISAFNILNNGDIVISSFKNRRIFIYSNKGEFIKSYPNKYSGVDDVQIWDIFQYNDSILVAKAIRGYPEKGRFFFLNINDFQLINNYWPAKAPELRYAGHDFHLRYKDKLLFHEMQNNNIYELTPDTAKIRYTIDIDGRTPPEGFWYRNDISLVDLVREYESKGYIDNIRFFSETKKHILLNYSGRIDVNSGYALINKNSKEYILFDEIAFENEFKWQPSIMYALADGQVIIPIPAEVILESLNSNLRKQFPDLKEDDNPVLFIGTLK